MEVRVLFWAPSFPLSKLFDQLKKATRSREQKSPGLLLEALQKAQRYRDPITPAEPGTPPGTEAAAAKPGTAAAPAQAGSESLISKSPSSYAGIFLALAILAIVWLAWNAAPWRAPEKIKIDPTGLKLDRTLDLQRQGVDRPTSKGTS